jgi:geranylgeranyl diphosphate synthase, type I
MTRGTVVDGSALEEARARLLPPLEGALQEFFSRPPVIPPDHLLPAGQSGGEGSPASAQARSRQEGASAVAAHYGMMRYHLGWLDEQLAPASAPTGKRLRPFLCLLATEACGEDARRALPAAVALELLHNFSLVHDDIEDNDAVRHHRPTVWTLWGEAQGINVGDGMHVLAYLALLPLARRGLPPDRVLRLVSHLARTSLIITEGQHLDLAFERRDDVSPADYLDMIGRKSAALIGCATTLGAEIADAPPEWTAALAQYGHQLGMAFQVRDDVLGIWGQTETTGKPAGDLYRKKKSLPTLYALNRAEGAEEAALRGLFAADLPGDEDVARALAVLDRTGARRHCEQMVGRYTAAAREHIAPLPPSGARDALEALASQLEQRNV